MKSVSKVNLVVPVTVLLVFLWAPADADTQKLPSDSDNAELKVEFRGDDTPDGIIFQSLIRRIASGYESAPDRTLEKVKSNMAFESDLEALEFIGLLDTEHRKLARAKAHARHAFICSAQADRSESQLFDDLDTLTAVEIDLAAAAYDDFSASLSPQRSARLDGWIQERKAGFSYLVTSAQQVTAKMGVNAVAHYKNQCTKIEQRLERMK